MTYTPVELRHVKVGRSLFGYNRATVEQVIEEVAQSFEATWRERGELADRVETLEKQLTELRGREHLLTQTLVAAEQAASDVREKARREAEVIITEAHNESRAIARSAHTQRETLLIESRRIEAMLRAALGVIQEGTSPTQVPASEPTPTPTPEPIPAASEPEPEAVPIPLPPVLEGDPEPVNEEIGWAREDTREFEPIAITPVEEAPTALVEPEPEQMHVPIEDPIDEHEHEHEQMHGESQGQPVLQSVPGRESRDFDWGE
jgi:DivIVA protein